MHNHKKNYNRTEKYNSHTLHHIVKHIKYNPYYALTRLEEYIETFYEDYYAYLCYIKTLIDVGAFEEAMSIIEFVESAFPNKVDSNLYYHKIRIYSFLGNYETAYQIYTDYKEDFLKIDNRTANFEVIYNKKVHNNVERSFAQSRYLYNQIAEYSHDDFINHISKHLASNNQNDKSPNPAIFNPDFPIEQVIEELKTIIPNDKRTYFNFSENFYVFKYDNCGKINNKNTDYFRVVTLHNTNKLITMYPMRSGAVLPYTDLNYLYHQEDKPKVKTLTRTEIFNQKYNIQN